MSMEQAYEIGRLRAALQLIAAGEREPRASEIAQKFLEEGSRI